MTSRASNSRTRPRLIARRIARLALLACLALNACNRFRTPQEGWNEEWGPLVPHQTFPADCALCHVSDGWDTLKPDFSFDHEKETGHALEGAHAEAACLRCHNDLGPVADYTARGCAGCHADIHKGTLTHDCEICHNERNWRPQGLVAEHARTRFPLFGAHLAAACEACHTGAPTGDFRNTPTECSVCHREDLAQALSPDHAAQGWTNTCERCHVPTSWGPGGFTHSWFPLEGGHAIECDSCHVGNDLSPLPTDCVSCHLTDYQNAPNHETFATTCQDCHTIIRWEGARFDHAFFPLTGGHSLSCEACHGAAGEIPKPATDCFSCHQDDYQTAPNHENFSTSCQECHTINAWAGADFNHNFFPLNGGHSIDCDSCHQNGQVPKPPTDCYACHRTDYEGAPNHVNNFATTCDDCHTINAWEGATVDHSFFPLNGGHAIDCDACHNNGQIPNPPTNCYACHKTDYDNADNHASFPTTCEQCHTIARWEGATFNHTSFPLNGNHNVSCNQCHTTNNAPQFSCIDCHAHRQSAMDSEHGGVKNYQWNSAACYDCHPNGRG